MLKRLHTIVAILVTLSMVAVPLVSLDVSAQQPAVEAETGNQVINVGEQTDTAPQTVQPRFAPPTGQDPLPQTQEPVSDLFLLDSVIRSCEDQTRFDLEWSGTGEILSIKYTLYNSSDNSHTDGEIDGSAGFGTSAIVWGKPGDTALSVDVTLVSGEEFSYLADASLCGTSEVHERGKQNTEATSVVPASGLSITNQKSATSVTTQMVTLVPETHGAALPNTTVIYVTNAQDNSQLEVYSHYRGIAGIGFFVDLVPGDYRWTFPAQGMWQRSTGTFTVGNSFLKVSLPLIAGNNGVIQANVTLPADYNNESPSLSFYATNAAGFTEYFQTRLLDGKVTIGPLAYGTYELVATPPWNYDSPQVTTVRIDSDVTVVDINFPKPVTSILSFDIDTGGVPVEDGWIRISDGLVWNGEYYTDTNIGESGEYNIEVLHPDDDQSVFYLVRSISHVEAYGEWYPGDATDIHIELAPIHPPSPRKVIDIRIKDSASGDLVGGLDLYARTYCDDATRMEQSGDIYQLLVFDDYDGYCQIAVYSGEWGGFYTWEFWISDVEGPLDYELTWDPLWAKDISMHVTVPDGIEPFSVILHYEDQPSGIVAEIGTDGIARFSALQKGNYRIRVGIHQEHYMVAELDDISVTTSGQTFEINVLPNPDLVTVNVEVRTSDGGDLPSALRVAHECGAKCGAVPSYELTPVGPTTTFQLQYPGQAPLTLYVGNIGGYHYSSVEFVPAETPNVTLTLVAVEPVPATPTAYLSANTGPARMDVRLTGGGYVPGELVTVRWGGPQGTLLAEATASDTGTIDVNLRVPASAVAGNYSITTNSTSGKSASAEFIVAIATIRLSIKSGRAGSATTVIGSGFQPGETVSIYWLGPAGPVLGTFEASDTGELIGRVNVPATAQLGTYNIYVRGDSSNQVGAVKYEVTSLVAVSLRLAITSGRAGSATTVIGSGFKPGETVTIYWLGPAGPVLGSFRASATGELVGRVNIPATTQLGTYNIYVRGNSSGQVGAVKYTVTHLVAVRLRLAIPSGRAGSPTTVIGSGFKPGESVTIYWLGPAGPVLGTFRASATGELIGRVNIPATAQLGTFNIYVRGNSSSQIGAVKYTVNRLVAVSLRLSPSSGQAGTTTTVIGSGFKPGETVTIRWGGTVGPIIGTTRASTGGNISVRITVPKNATRTTHSIVAQGGTSKQVGVVKYTVTLLASADPIRQEYVISEFYVRS